ncbi:MAG TPA: putative zinc-binding metallopeptidase, partial [Rhizomicrobium sp.]
MKLFSCQGCGQLLYFENIRCESCGRALGYLTDLTEISALDVKPEGGFEVLAAPGKAYKFCHNYDAGMCNWMLPADSPEEFCAACRHNRTVPDLSVSGNDALWRKLETAKHRLFYSLLRLGLPLENRTDNPEHGLAFDFLADPPESHAAGVMTGHDNGLITLAIREADDAVRERVRGEMGEPYRTLLGHMRHESGHYFWDRLVATDE